MMKRFAFIILLTLAVAMQVNAQDNTIHTPKGAIVKIFTGNTGDKIKLNDVVTMEVVQKTEKDSVLFSSYTLGHAIKIPVQPSQNVGDLMDVLPLLAVKDSAYVKIPSDSVFKGHDEQRPPFLPKGSNLIFVIKVEKIESLNEVLETMRTAEITGAEKYIADNKLKVTTTASGLKYVVTQPSTKPKAQLGDTVLVNYKGYFLDGKVFDTSIQAEAEKAGLQQPGRHYEPYPVTLGTGVVQGWTEALSLMNEGSKMKIIVPSSLGYGAEGYGDIPPYSTLGFDLELVKIKPAKHAAVKPAAKPAAKKATTKKHVVTKKKS
ncbi:MAG TPA: FKBP-type peptidyl-prolyl cis-trans isomerase [Mucilaginibacter sp.]|nr:FKBP-type peptidyl-prolyl cis-trans isomerase [Mucilaginibacter sp.]